MPLPTCHNVSCPSVLSIVLSKWAKKSVAKKKTHCGKTHCGKWALSGQKKNIHCLLDWLRLQIYLNLMTDSASCVKALDYFMLPPIAAFARYNRDRVPMLVEGLEIMIFVHEWIQKDSLHFCQFLPLPCSNLKRVKHLTKSSSWYFLLDQRSPEFVWFTVTVLNQKVGHGAPQGSSLNLTYPAWVLICFSSFMDNWSLWSWETFIFQWTQKTASLLEQLLNF